MKFYYGGVLTKWRCFRVTKGGLRVGIFAVIWDTGKKTNRGY